MPLGRRFRALKLWAVLRCYGREGLQAVIREHLRLAGLFEQWVRDEPGWEVCAPRPFSLVCFRREGTDEENEALLESVNASGEAFLSHTRLDGRLVLRLAIGNARTTEDDVRHRVGAAAPRGGGSRASATARAPRPCPRRRGRRPRAARAAPRVRPPRRGRRARDRRGRRTHRRPCGRLPRRARAVRRPGATSVRTAVPLWASTGGRTSSTIRPHLGTSPAAAASSATRVRYARAAASSSARRKWNETLSGFRSYGQSTPRANSCMRSAQAAASGSSSSPCSPTIATPSIPSILSTSGPDRPLTHATRA